MAKFRRNAAYITIYTTGVISAPLAIQYGEFVLSVTSWVGGL